MAKQRTTAAQGLAVPAPITGVASGGLGTAANLEDTQLWDLEELRGPAAEDAFEPEDLPEPPEPARRATHAPMPAAAARPEPLPVHATAVRAPRGQRRTGVIAAAAAGLIALAALLAFRDGLPGGASRGSGDAAGAFPSLPPAASVRPQPTAAPDAGGGGGGKDHGNGGGNGKGHGNN